MQTRGQNQLPDHIQVRVREHVARLGERDVLRTKAGDVLFGKLDIDRITNPVVAALDHYHGHSQFLPNRQHLAQFFRMLILFGCSGIKLARKEKLYQAIATVFGKPVKLLFFRINNRGHHNQLLYLFGAHSCHGGGDGCAIRASQHDGRFLRMIQLKHTQQALSLCLDRTNGFAAF